MNAWTCACCGLQCLADFLIARGFAALQEEAYGAQKELAKLRAELALAKSASLASEAVRLDSGARMLVARLDGADNKSLQASTALLLIHQALTVWYGALPPLQKRDGSHAGDPSA